ncbi:MAG: hypothetical protein QOE86_1834 [Solirubrobacteraceae bacterium]|jgi:short subunit dehydrogenase-like uncharacterized protein|nr:hypothetical protein [Solirubrobacteraceae bacterium]
MAGRIVLFGATGFTGGLVAERLVAQGERPVLAGRDPERLKRLADRLGSDLETVKADVLRQNSVFSAVGDGDVLVSTVGPFAKYGDVAVRAATAAGATYLDSTGEPSFIRRVFQQFDEPARRQGAALLTAMGYDWVPGALAGALALDRAGAGAVRVDVGYYALGGGAEFASPGTKESLVGATLDPAFAFRDGRLVTERGGARIRTFRIAGRDRPAMSIGAAEHFTLPAAFPQLRDVNAYLGWFGPLTRAVAAGSLATSIVTRVPGTRAVMQAAGERLMALAPSRTAESAGSSTSFIAAEAYAADGTRLADVLLQGADGYAFTAGLLSWAARRAASTGVDGTGALSPVAAFGLEALTAGAAEAGISESP